MLFLEGGFWQEQVQGESELQLMLSKKLSPGQGHVGLRGAGAATCTTAPGLGEL